MPRFLTESELRAEFGEAVIDRLADRNADGVVDDDVVEEAILDAEDEALGHLLNRFSDAELPADTTEASRRLKLLVGGLAYHRLHKHYDVLPEKALNERVEALSGLRSIASGQLSVVLEDQPAVDTSRPLVVASKRSTSLGEQKISMLSMDRWGHE